MEDNKTEYGDIEEEKPEVKKITPHLYYCPICYYRYSFKKNNFCKYR